MSEITVVKKSGYEEPFSEEKVVRSMRRVGLSEELFDQVIAHIREKVHGKVSTDEIFHHITEFLDEKDKKASLKFNLKQAIFELGPSGFPFEKYFERILQESGYKTETNLVMRGECITHEIDILIEKEGVREIIEAKFHNQQGVKTDAQDLLYTNARFWDVKETNNIERVWIVTNTKLSEDARAYAECKGIRAIGWSYPYDGSLQDLVEQPYLYPVTILSNLRRDQKQRLIDENIVMCRDIIKMDDAKLKSILQVNDEELQKTKQTADLVCSIG